MVWKVCGMIDKANILEVLALEPDYMGFIFHPPSKRYALSTLNGPKLDRDLRLNFPSQTQKVGVFVNAEMSTILELSKEYGLNVIQLHGEETPSFAQELKSSGIKVWKVFSVGEDGIHGNISDFDTICDAYLFDTLGKHPGGNGIGFDWRFLQTEQIQKPFLLSGGIHHDQWETIVELKEKLPFMLGLDVNSKYEIKPGFKDVEALKILKSKIDSLRL